MNAYAKFGIMILTSTFLMYWLMFLNVFQLDPIFYSETRVYMALIMGSVMAIVMLLFMWPMYKNKKTNTVILGGSAVIFALSLWLVRSQLLVEDVNLTSERANISDPRVRELADSIIEAQRKEIAEMKKLIKDLEDEE
ncbi:DUF305 domain-containing protein [Planococcus sp. S3-L1]|uniref:DUF305 domain-containing protein n=1 Tax=Planococcus sp. S3-L1 TaxID=3046200 RepID=UPI0024B8B4D0|nr:DUF305 domain-containing protein [Planococcus sp. S3-L1]MDJ0332373.1 DUF305 domain-containing protein [Planococcus sp. S3-L1]